MCKAGEWTEVSGDAVTDTKCNSCTEGHFRAQAPTDNTKAEKGDDVCIEHRMCKAGEWTQAAGSVITDTTCVPCKTNTFREKGPTNTLPENEEEVCKPA